MLKYLMPLDILVKFRDFPAVEIELEKNRTAQYYKALIKKNLMVPPTFRDQGKYTPEHFKTLAVQAKKVLGWDWLTDDCYNIEITTRLHKDIEEYIGGNTAGFCQIPEEHDALLHELHFCLHALQGHKHRGSWLQVEWFNDMTLPLPKDFVFSDRLEFGDLRLQNCYVGHSPLFVYEQNDYTNISQTCKFHDLIRPGINLVIHPQRFMYKSKDEYLAWFQTHAPEFVSKHGIEKLMYYTGHPKIGRVCNIDILQQLVSSPTLELESVVVL